VERVPAEQNGVSVEGRFLTRAEFRRLSDVPPEAEWFANIDNENTRLAYSPSRIELFFELENLHRLVPIR
jgi:integrase/recombinase XerD